jgi:hypothetical protein
MDKAPRLARRTGRLIMAKEMDRQLMIGMAVAIGLSTVAVSAIGSAVAQAIAHDAVIGGYQSPVADGAALLGDRHGGAGLSLTLRLVSQSAASRRGAGGYAIRRSRSAVRTRLHA